MTPALKLFAPLTVLSLALFAGWFQRTSYIPEGAMYSWLYTLSGGYLPAALGGAFQPCPVPEVPDHMYAIAPPSYATYLTLPGTGDKLPQSGIGMCCRATAYDHESVRRSILWFLLLGGRHIDTAQVYGNHAAIGEALRDAEEMYGIPRSDVFVTTKVWNRNYGYFSTLKAIPRILEELGLDYVDMLLMHASTTSFFGLSASSECSEHSLSSKDCRAMTWKGLAVAQKRGMVRNIGVSNFNVKQLQELQAIDRATIAVNQMAYNPWVPDDLQETYDYCKANGIQVVARSSLAGSTLQSDKALSQQPLQEIAGMYNRTEAQVLLRWSMQKGNAIIPGTGNPSHMVENLEVYDFFLVQEDMAKIDSLRTEQSAKNFIFSASDMS